MQRDYHKSFMTFIFELSYFHLFDLLKETDDTCYIYIYIIVIEKMSSLMCFPV